MYLYQVYGIISGGALFILTRLPFQGRNFVVVCCLLFFLTKLTFSKKSFRNTIRVSNGLDLGPNCSQRLSADNRRAWKKLKWNVSSSTSVFIISTFISDHGFPKCSILFHNKTLEITA